MRRGPAASRSLLPHLAAIVPFQKAQNSRTARSTSSEASGRRTETRSLRCSPRLSAKVALGPEQDEFAALTALNDYKTPQQKSVSRPWSYLSLRSSLSPFWLSALASTTNQTSTQTNTETSQKNQPMQTAAPIPFVYL